MRETHLNTTTRDFIRVKTPGATRADTVISFINPRFVVAVIPRGGEDGVECELMLMNGMLISVRELPIGFEEWRRVD